MEISKRIKGKRQEVVMNHHIVSRSDVVHISMNGHSLALLSTASRVIYL